jgi:hypothetical protein
MSKPHALSISRRAVLAALAAPALVRAESLPPIRPITKGPKFHWFGYYDKLQFDPASRYALGVEGAFEHRLPTGDDKIAIGMVDTEEGDQWTALGESRAWSWHQTSMLQWLPNSDREIIWNDRLGDHFGAHILDVKTRKHRTIDSPIYCLHPDGRSGLANDFRRLYDVRPETGYAGVPDPNSVVAAPDNAGIWHVNLANGKRELLLSFADAVKVEDGHSDWTGAKHWFNHLLYAPDGKRFVFLHRWRKPGQGRGFTTRMFTANADGTGLRLLDPSGRTSHFIWRDPTHLLVWTHRESHGSRFYLFEDAGNGTVEPVAPDILTRNGHCSYLPGNRWILSDTGPDEERLQHPLLFDTKTNRLVPLGHFHSPPEYTGVWRCDTTPRFSPDGKKVVFDSPHGGNGRQMYLVDVSAITAA